MCRFEQRATTCPPLVLKLTKIQNPPQQSHDSQLGQRKGPDDDGVNQCIPLHGLDLVVAAQVVIVAAVAVAGGDLDKDLRDQQHDPAEADEGVV